MTKECRECRYFRAHWDGKQGWCRRYPPKMQWIATTAYQARDPNSEGSLQTFDLWVDMNYWCGEWKPTDRGGDTPIPG